MIDIDALSQPVSEDNPVGENTEYTELAELVRLSAGNPGKPNPQTQEMEGREDPDWRKVHASASDLLKRTKDVRVACILARAELAMDGLAGLGRGLQLVARLLTDYWDSVYPQLDKDENDDPIERLNALAYLCDPERFIVGVRDSPFVESREVGRFNGRDLDLALGRLPPPEGTEPPSADLLAAAWRAGDGEARQAKVDGVKAGLGALAEVESLFRERTSEQVDVDLLKQNLRRLKEFYDQRAEEDAQDAGEGEGEGSDGIPSSGGEGGGSRVGGLSSRADAVRILKQVADYLRRVEPSSPAPMFIDRAIKVMSMDFTAIVRELMPDALARVELLSGIPLDAESPPSE